MKRFLKAMVRPLIVYAVMWAIVVLLDVTGKEWLMFIGWIGGVIALTWNVTHDMEKEFEKLLKEIK